MSATVSSTMKVPAQSAAATSIPGIQSREGSVDIARSDPSPNPGPSTPLLASEEATESKKRMFRDFAKTEPDTLFTAKAMWKWSSSHVDELNFERGQIIHVVEVMNDDWYLGHLGESTAMGLFPANHVKKCE